MLGGRKLWKGKSWRCISTFLAYLRMCDKAEHLCFMARYAAYERIFVVLENGEKDNGTAF